MAPNGIHSKVLKNCSESLAYPPLGMLSFVAYHYHLGENLLSYADSEKDLGVHVNKSFAILLTKANQF